MPGIDQAHATALILYSMGGTAGLPAPTIAPLHLRLMIANGTWTGLGTELPAGGSYVPGMGITPVPVLVIAPGTVANSAVLTQRNMPACRITGAELWDSSPHRMWFGELLEGKPCNPGDTFTVVAGAMSIGIGNAS